MGGPAVPGRPPRRRVSSAMLVGVCGRTVPSASAVHRARPADQPPGTAVGSAPSLPARPARVRPPAGAHRRCRVVGVPREQAHVPAEQPSPVQDPRLPAADAHPRRPGDPRRSSAQGSREALRLRCCPRRHACAGVRSSPRSSGPAGAPGGRPWCSTTSPNGPSRPVRGGPRRTRRPVPRAGFVVGKAVGNSVVRHRVTRRLRAVGRRRAAPAARRPPTWSCGPAPRRPTAELRSCCAATCAGWTGARPAAPRGRAGRDRRRSAGALLGVIRFYQRAISPALPAAVPLLARRCSAYAAEAIERARRRARQLAGAAPAGEVRALAPGRRRPRARRRTGTDREPPTRRAQRRRPRALRRCPTDDPRPRHEPPRRPPAGPRRRSRWPLLDWLYTAISWVMKEWHAAVLAPSSDPAGGLTWALSIVFLVVTDPAAAVPALRQAGEVAAGDAGDPAGDPEAAASSTAATGRASARR